MTNWKEHEWVWEAESQRSRCLEISCILNALNEWKNVNFSDEKAGGGEPQAGPHKSELMFEKITIKFSRMTAFLVSKFSRV